VKDRAFFSGVWLSLQLAGLHALLEERESPWEAEAWNFLEFARYELAVHLAGIRLSANRLKQEQNVRG